MDPNPSSSSLVSPPDRETASSVVRTRKDPYTAPQYSFGNRVQRQLWSFVWIFLTVPLRGLHTRGARGCCDVLAQSLGRIVAFIPALGCGRLGTCNAKTQ